jgi:PAS domain S-box-containing protein
MGADQHADPPRETIEELYDRAPCGYLTTTLDGRIAHINSTMCEWLGYSADQLTAGTRVQDLMNVPGKIYFETHLLPHLSLKGEVSEVAFDLLRADRSMLPVLLHAQRKTDATAALQFYRFTIFNARERRRYERELLSARREAERASAALEQLNDTLAQRVEQEVAQRLKAEAALRQAQKMEALGQLTGGVAHDFNNLLTVIMGGLDTILGQLDAAPVSPSSARQRRAAQMALQGAQAAAGLTHRLLAFSRQQPLDPKPVDLNATVLGMSELLRRTLGEGITFETVLAAGLWHTKLDVNQLENALINLAVNARDALPRGGQLTIETWNSHLDEQYVAHFVPPLPPGQYVCIAINDTGTGMDAATLEKVFEPFFTTKELGKGTGLGLSQVYGFVNQSGGNVKIYSEVGRGTSVKMYLPRYIATKTETQPEVSEALDVSGRGETVLVVEDDALLRAYAREALEELGYVVLEAEDAQGALALIELHDEISLLFTDLVLPRGTTGAQLAERVRARRPNVRVLFSSGYSRNALARQEQLLPRSSFISKPYTIAALARELRLALELKT